MSVEFDPTSRDEQPEEHLPEPRSHRRRWMVLAGTGALVVVLGGGAVAWAQTTSPTPTTSSSYAPHGGSRPTGQPSGIATPRPITPSMSGTVKSVSGATILITDVQGFTRTIKTSAKTVYKDSLTAAPAVGTKIEAEGTVDADGTSLDATLIQAPRQFAGGAGGPGGSGGGHFGGPGARPSGAPTGERPTGVPSGKFTHTAVPQPKATATGTA